MEPHEWCRSVSSWLVCRHLIAVPGREIRKGAIFQILERIFPWERANTNMSTTPHRVKLVHIRTWLNMTASMSIGVPNAQESKSVLMGTGTAHCSLKRKSITAKKVNEAAESVIKLLEETVRRLENG